MPLFWLNAAIKGSMGLSKLWASVLHQPPSWQHLTQSSVQDLQTLFWPQVRTNFLLPQHPIILSSSDLPDLPGTMGKSKARGKGATKSSPSKVSAFVLGC